MALTIGRPAGSRGPARKFGNDGDPQTLQIFVSEQTERRREVFRQKDRAAGYERRLSSLLGQR